MKMVYCRITSCRIYQGKPGSLNGFSDSGQMMIMSKHNQHHLISFSCCLSSNYNSIIAAKLNLTLIV